MTATEQMRVDVETFHFLLEEFQKLQQERQEAEEIRPYAYEEGDEERVYEIDREVETIDVASEVFNALLRKARERAENPKTPLPDEDIPF